MDEQESQNMNIEKTLASSGDRLKRARVLAGLNTRREFEEKHQISANTLQGWEQGKNPLSEKGARRVVEALKKEGLMCTVEWLMHGKGMPPRPFDVLNAGVGDSVRTDPVLAELNIREEENIYRETQLFKELNLNSIVLTINDDAMEPYFSVGDYIGGVRLFNDEIERYLGTVCIIEFENNLILPRHLQKGSREGSYTASCTNPKTTAPPPLNLYDVKVISAAPILWHRKKITSFN